MKFAIMLGALNPSAWLEATRAADRLGFESVWISEHLVLPVAADGSPVDGDAHPPIPADVPIYDALGYLCFLAGKTERIGLGTYVYNIGLRHPFVVARAAATLDIVSGGRLEFGIGASWLRGEWDATGLDFDQRGSRVDESIDVCRRLWTEPTVEHHGRWFDFPAVCFEPKPTTPGGVRLHVGGDGSAALRRAGTVGDGWMPMNHSLEQIPEAAARIAVWRNRAGRHGRTEITLAAPVESDADVERLRAAGVDRVLVRPWRRSAEAVDALERFATAFL
jgi:probable F420-dependent oxidoreductase